MENVRESLISFILSFVDSETIDRDIIEYADLVDDLGMDSIEFISMIVAVESMFGITVSDDLLLIDNFRRVDDIAGIVEKLKSVSNDSASEVQND